MKPERVVESRIISYLGYLYLLALWLLPWVRARASWLQPFNAGAL